MLPPATRSTAGRVVHYDGTAGAAVSVEVAAEVPVNIVYATLPFAVMMATPADLEDFATGFSFTEGVVREPDEIRAIALTAQPLGILAEIDLAPAALRRHMARRRSLSGRTGCGLCGIESLEQLPAATPVRAPLRPVGPAAIRRALGALDAAQTLHHATHAVHAAAWCDRDGGLLLLREDVGRHNALDKLIGACLRAGLAPDAGFVVLTSRCSFEMVEKAAAYGAATVVAISAPTTLAIDRALALGISLVAVARHDAAIRFTPGAVTASPPVPA